MLKAGLVQVSGTSKLKHLVEAVWFQNFIVSVIVLAAIVVGLETYPNVVARYGPILSALDKIILGIFVAEIIMKLGAYGRNWRHFFNDGWNVIDLIIVAICLVPINAEFVTVFRLARILRVLRLITALPRLQLIVGALIKSVPSIAYIGVLLMLFFYVFAVLAVSFFGQNDPFRFGNLQISLLTLFQIVTMENWVELMHTQMYGCDQFGYDDAIKHLCTAPQASPVGAPAFFVIFIVLGTMIILNLFIGVIMKGMEEMQEEVDQQRIKQGHGKDVFLEHELDRLARELQALRNSVRRKDS